MGTHPIFESDFDCLTECVIICVDKMSFEVASAAGLEKFNKFLLDNSYVSGWTPTQKDVDIFKAIKSSPDGKYGNVLRWWKNISSYSSEFGSLAAGSASARWQVWQCIEMVEEHFELQLRIWLARRRICSC